MKKETFHVKKQNECNKPFMFVAPRVLVFARSKISPCLSFCLCLSFCFERRPVSLRQERYLLLMRPYREKSTCLASRLTPMGSFYFFALSVFLFRTLCWSLILDSASGRRRPPPSATVLNAARGPATWAHTTFFWPAIGTKPPSFTASYFQIPRSFVRFLKPFVSQSYR